MMKLAQPLVCQKGGDYDGNNRDARRVRPNPNSLNILQCFPFEDTRTVRPYLSSVYLALLNNSAQASSSRVTTRSNASGPS